MPNPRYDWLSEEVLATGLGQYLNRHTAAGRFVFAILDGSASRKTHVLVVTYAEQEKEPNHGSTTQTAKSPARI